MLIQFQNDRTKIGRVSFLLKLTFGHENSWSEDQLRPAVTWLQCLRTLLSHTYFDPAQTEKYHLLLTKSLVESHKTPGRDRLITSCSPGAGKIFQRNIFTGSGMRCQSDQKTFTLQLWCKVLWVRHCWLCRLLLLDTTWLWPVRYPWYWCNV